MYLLPCLPGEYYLPKTHILLFTFIFLLTAQFHTGPIMWPLTGRLTGVGTCQLNKYLNEIQSPLPLKWDAASSRLSTSGGILRPLQLGAASHRLWDNEWPTRLKVENTDVLSGVRTFWEEPPATSISGEVQNRLEYTNHWRNISWWMLHKYAKARKELEAAPQPQLCFLFPIISSISHN